MEKQKIYASNTEDRLALAAVLIKNGYTVRMGRERAGNKTVCFVEYWREGNAVSLENLQKTVGGYIETVTLCKDFVVICNEEGRLHRLPWCCEICGVDFVGTIILCGIDGEDFGDIPITYQDAKRILPRLWEEKRQ